MKRILIALLLLLTSAAAQNKVDSAQQRAVSMPAFNPNWGGAPQLTGLWANVIGGQIMINGNVVTVSDARIPVPPNATSYVYVDLTTGEITSNTTGFLLIPVAYYPVAILTTNSTFITGSVDARPDVFGGSTGGGAGTITSVNAGTGLSGGGNTGSVTLTLFTGCSPTQVLQWDGSTWGCANNGTPTGVAAGSQLVSNGVSQPPVYQVKPQCHTTDMAGADVGAKVAACISGPLSGISGEVRIDSGGTWRTQVTVPSGIDIIYDSLAGNIANAMADRTPILLMNSNTSLQCESWSNYIQVPAFNNETLVCGKDQGATCSSTSASISNVKVNGCHFKTSGGLGSPLDGVIWLENCTNCTTNNNFFEGIKSIDILLGAASSTGNRSQYYSVIGNKINGWSNCAICVINASNFEIAGNQFSAKGNGAAGAIDIEPNAATDYAEFGDVHDNIDDASTNSALFVDYGITLQCAGYPHCQHIRIHDNVFTDGEPGAASGRMEQCYSTEGSYMSVYNNTCTNSFSGVAITVAGDHGEIHDNKAMCSTIQVVGVNNTLPATGNVIENNVLSNNNCGLSAATSRTYSTIWETNFSGTSTFSDHNIYRGNKGVTSYALVSGNGSQILDDPQADNTGLTARVANGFPSGIAGGLNISQLAVPSGLAKGGSVIGGCSGGLTANTYFYKVTATDVFGETTASGEISYAAGGVNGCFYLIWTKVTGASCYNVYRSTTTNTEQLITASPVCSGATVYADVGGQTPGATVPISNTTGSAFARKFQSAVDASANAALANGQFGCANQTGTGGASSAAGNCWYKGGDNASVNSGSSAGGAELSAGQSTSATPGKQGLVAITSSYVKGTTVTQWNLQCSQVTSQQTQDCLATPSNMVGVAETVGTNAVRVIKAGFSPINASAAVTQGDTVCAGTTAGQITDSGGTAACSSGSTIGTVYATSGTWSLPDGTSFTASATLPLVDLQGFQPSGGGGGGSLTGSGTSGSVSGWTSPTNLTSTNLQFTNGGASPLVEVAASGGTPLSTTNAFEVTSLTSDNCIFGSPTIPSANPACWGQLIQSGGSNTGATSGFTGLWVIGGAQGIAATNNNYSNAGLFQANTTGTTATEVRGLEVDALPGSAGVTTNRAFVAVAKNGGTNTRTNTTQQAIYAQTQFSAGASTTTNDYGVYIDSPSITSTATLTHHYGLYLADQTVAGSGTNSDPWGITVAGPSKNQYGTTTGDASIDNYFSPSLNTFRSSLDNTNRLSNASFNSMSTAQSSPVGIIDEYAPTANVAINKNVLDVQGLLTGTFGTTGWYSPVSSTINQGGSGSYSLFANFNAHASHLFGGGTAYPTWAVGFRSESQVFGSASSAGFYSDDQGTGASNYGIYLAGNTHNNLGTYQDISEIAAPANPASGQRVYANSSTHQLSCLTSSGSNCMPGTGTVTTTGSPVSGELTQFSGATSITNGNLSGDVTTSNTLATTVAKIQGTTVTLTSPASGQIINVQNGPIIGNAYPGVPIDLESGATYTVRGDGAGSDRVSVVQTSNNTTSTAVTLPQAGSAGFGSNYAFAGMNTGSVVATYTPTTSTINGNSTMKFPGKVAGHSPSGALVYSDNTNYWALQFLPTDANGLLAAEGFPALTGDVTNSAGTLATTVGKVNGAAVPTSATVLGSNGSNQLVAASLQGNGTKVQLSTGTTTTNDCVKFDANGNTVDAGGACAGGAPSFPVTVTGTVTSGGIPYFSSTTVESSSGLLAANSPVLGGGAGAAPSTVAGITSDGTSKITLGVSTTSVGAVAFNNLTSGSVTLQPVTGALGTVTASLPAATGTIALDNASDTTTTHFLAATATGHLYGARAIAAGDLPTSGISNVAYLNAVNAFTSAGTIDLHAATTANALQIPAGAGLTSNGTSSIAYDSTSKNTHIPANNADAIAAAFPAAPATNHVPVTVVGSGTVTLADGFTATAGTITSGHLACYTASNTIGNCTAIPASNVIGVFNSSTTFIDRGEQSVVLDATVSVTFGDILCVSQTTANVAHDNGSVPCPLGQTVGTVKTTAASVGSATAFIALR